ncbi:DUF6930 domain-containing protein [Thermosynechococcus vestitus]|uniref:Tll0650 protein n=1 Tax=Thermosynechococcus vestitus (strain NIES-2133 / IAM M-273 / BP-1) TaxID=197221 RepID=Q8DL48_THEVB|nr:hypothetical protein [Thermosynechococcus vestitus]BAC08201.1 tll0650 [Thermosynechococcus vestitus BP-1]
MRLPTATIRRLLNLPQVADIWVGGGRSLNSDNDEVFCAAWLDPKEQLVRTMEIRQFPPTPEQLMRLLVQAIESPHHPQAQPCRPHAIIVDDRELQFFLRGVVAPLDIQVEYQARVPLLDDFFELMAAEVTSDDPDLEGLPREYVPLYKRKIRELAQLDIWRRLNHVTPFKLHCSSWDCPTLFAVLVNPQGASRDFGLMLHRGEEALRNFWQQIDQEDPYLDEEDDDRLEETVLRNDCLFLNVSEVDEADLDNDLSFVLRGHAYTIEVGVVHPLEGIRHFYAPEEAEMVYVAIASLIKFWKKTKKQFEQEAYPELNLRFQIPSPCHCALSYQVQVATAPEMMPGIDEDTEESQSLCQIPIDTEAIPEEAYILFKRFPPKELGELQAAVAYHQRGEIPEEFKGYPVLTIQTKKSAAAAIAAKIAEEGGIHHLTVFPLSGPEQIVMLLAQTNANHLWLLDTFDAESGSLLLDWIKEVNDLDGACGLAVAYGVTGKTRRQPTLKQIVGLFETSLVFSFVDTQRPPTPQPIEISKP